MAAKKRNTCIEGGCGGIVTFHLSMHAFNLVQYWLSLLLKWLILVLKRQTAVLLVIFSREAEFLFLFKLLQIAAAFVWNTPNNWFCLPQLFLTTFSNWFKIQNLIGQDTSLLKLLSSVLTNLVDHLLIVCTFFLSTLYKWDLRYSPKSSNLFSLLALFWDERDIPSFGPEDL